MPEPGDWGRMPPGWERRYVGQHPYEPFFEGPSPIPWGTQSERGGYFWRRGKTDTGVWYEYPEETPRPWGLESWKEQYKLNTDPSYGMKYHGIPDLPPSNQFLPPAGIVPLPVPTFTEQFGNRKGFWPREPNPYLQEQFPNYRDFLPGGPTWYPIPQEAAQRYEMDILPRESNPGEMQAPPYNPWGRWRHFAEPRDLIRGAPPGWIDDRTFNKGMLEPFDRRAPAWY